MTRQHADFWKGGHTDQSSGRACFFSVVAVHKDQRTCDIKTFGSDAAINTGTYHNVQWLSPFTGINGEDFGGLPVEKSIGVCMFLDGVPWILGFFNSLTTSDEAESPDAEDEGVEQVGGSAAYNKEILNPGDMLLRNASGCRIALRAGGEIEIEATKVCKRMHLPTQNRISDLCQNYEILTDAGTLEWGHPTPDSEQVRHFQSYKDTIRGNNIILEEKGTIPEDPDIIWRVRIGTPASFDSDLTSMSSIKSPVFIKSVYKNGAVDYSVNKNAVTKYVGADGHTLFGVGGYNYFHEIRPSGEMVLNVSNKFNLLIGADGWVSMEAGIAGMKIPNMPPSGGKGRFSLLISPTGSMNMNVNGLGDFVMDTMGGVALSTAGRGTITIDPTGAISLTAVRSVDVKAPIVNLSAGLLNLGAVPIDNSVMGNLLLSQLNPLIAQIKAHNHIGAHGPTSPAIGIATPALVSAAVLSATVRVQK